MKRLIALALAFVVLPALALDEDAERQRISTERDAVEARFKEQQIACRGTFAVTDCMRKARREYYAKRDELKRQQLVLDAEQRRRKAAERQKDLEERNSPEAREKAEQRRREAVEESKERQARGQEKARQRAADDAKRTGKAPTTPGSPPAPPHAAQGPKAPPKSHAPTAEEQAKNRAAFEHRKKEAAEHNAQLQQRIATRKKPAASDLPMPP